MSVELRAVLNHSKINNRPAFVAYVTAGYPKEENTVDILLGLQKGGADIIEVGVPFSDPTADGPTIQKASFDALKNGTSLLSTFDLIRKARQAGLWVPVVLMGYYNPFYAYGEEKLLQDCSQIGVQGLIIVDYPPREALHFFELSRKYGISYIPLIAPSTSETRISEVVSLADSFVYVVSTLGTTGARTEINKDLDNYLARIRKYTKLPLAVGFGVSNHSQFKEIGSKAEAVVIGSKIITTISEQFKKNPKDIPIAVTNFASEITGRKDVTVPDYIVNGYKAKSPENHPNINTEVDRSAFAFSKEHYVKARFGDFGGQFAPEILLDCLDELEKAYDSAKADPKFWDELRTYQTYTGRPSPLQFADRLTDRIGGARIWLKREDLNHTGSHKINNALGQALIAKRLGKSRIIAETGAGQHGVATATVCAKLGLKCVIYMGSKDVERQALNVFRMKLLGAKVVSVTAGSCTLKEAVNEAMREWVTSPTDTHYLIGSAIGPHPFPEMVRDFQSVIGRETRADMLARISKLPDAVVACVGGGSNAIGMFHPFVNDPSVRLIGVEAGGDGIDTDKHSATICKGTPGVLHGTKTFLIQDKNGQVEETHSISAGLDYPAVGPEHSWLAATKRAEYISASDSNALEGFRILCETEGIIPALESSHAVHGAIELAKTLPKNNDIVICLSGRGDKDVTSVALSLPTLGPKIGWDLRFEGELHPKASS